VAFFHYPPDRKAECPFEHLRNFGGIPQADAYAVSIDSTRPGAFRRRPVGVACAGRFTLQIRYRT
jgi:hypothetical protein